MTAMEPGSRLYRLLEIGTVGFPFCAFKILTGSVLVAWPPWRALGWALVGLGSVDLVLNAVGFVLAAAGRGAALPVCTSEWLVRRLRPRRESWRRLGLSVDAALSFALVAAMIGGGWFARLSPAAASLWGASVVLNVLGAGLGRLAESVASVHAESGATAERP